MSPKVFIIVLVAVALLFALVVVAGAGRRRDTSADTERGTLARLLKKLYREERVSPSEVNAECSAGGALVLKAGSSCAASVAKSEKRVRTAVFRLAEGVEAKVVFTPAPNDDLSVPLRATLKAGGETKVQVMPEGGTLQLVCVGGSGSPARCLIRLD
jgi:hypothetical protein